MAGEQDIHARLLAFGFTEEFFGDAHPPATHYHLGGEVSGFYAEFLTPQVGGEYDRKHGRKAVIEIAGVATQQLCHIELLLHRPWSVDPEYAGSGAQIQIANPVTFLAQKILIYRRRERADRAKDILYMHDTLEVFGARLPELADLWRSDVAARLNRRHLNIVSRVSREMFARVGDDIRRAADISAERALDPEDLRQSCYYGFNEVFGA